MHLPAGRSAPSRDQSSLAEIAKYKNSRKCQSAEDTSNGMQSIALRRRQSAATLTIGHEQNPERLSSVLSDQSVAADALVRQKPEDNEDDGKDKDDAENDENNDATRSE